MYESNIKKRYENAAVIIQAVQRFAKSCDTSGHEAHRLAGQRARADPALRRFKVSFKHQLPPTAANGQHWMCAYWRFSKPTATACL